MSVKNMSEKQVSQDTGLETENPKTHDAKPTTGDPRQITLLPPESKIPFVLCSVFWVQPHGFWMGSERAKRSSRRVQKSGV
jgi:hypothetical protein